MSKIGLRKRDRENEDFDFLIFPGKFHHRQAGNFPDSMPKKEKSLNELMNLEYKITINDLQRQRRRKSV
jgi:hypothetical protein